MRAMYIHIPFCHQICNYCDFNKVYFKNQPVDEYLGALQKELQMYAERFSLNSLETVFIGGGTPTSLSPQQLEVLLTAIQKVVDVESLREYTIEANPDELTREKLEVLYRGGVRRLSIGVQSFNDDHLRTLGRTHSASDVKQVIAEAKTVGFNNISIDLIYGLPEQTIEDWQDTLQQAFDLHLPHYSTYSLIIEPKTVFYNLRNNDQLKLPDASIEGEMFTYVIEEMKRRGYTQYEVSNFALPHYESVHNCVYWENDEYVGIGAGAHGYVDGIRYSNIGPVQHYIDGVTDTFPRRDEHRVTKKEAMEEEMFLGLRMTKGVSRQAFLEKFQLPIEEVYGLQLEQLKARGLMEEINGHWTLTKEGLYRGNDVFEQFLLS